MRRITLLFGVLLGALPMSPSQAATDAEVAAHRSALDLAGAFSNDEFKLRDGHLLGGISTAKPVLVQVNLYAGNQYWFSVGATNEAGKIGVSVYDETGKAMVVEPYQNGAQAAAGFSPQTSGPYYIRIEELQGTPATYCFLYSYK